MSEKDTIVALATAHGVGALAIVRLSGPAALSILSRVFVPKSEGKAGSVKERVLTAGSITDPDSGTEIDSVLGVKMPSPHSYTGEDVVEITCHGSPAIISKILEAAVRQGARLAEPGEFTKRAFLNGKIDLAQAEAVCDLIMAQTSASSNIALRQLRGELSTKLRSLQQNLVKIAAEIEARIDFPEEDLGKEDARRIQSDMAEVANRIDEILEGGERGKLFRTGVRIPIVGKPNTGKSSLFNTLVRRERAIVTPHPGTTRDTIETTVEIDGIAVTFIDTAGVRVEPDEIERLGISRTEDEIGSADLTLFLIDRSIGLDEEDMRLYELIRHSKHLIVINKIDIPGKISINDVAEKLGLTQEMVWCEVSALLKRNINVLEEQISDTLTGDFGGRAIATEEILVSNLRHIRALRRAKDAVGRAINGVREGISGEFIMVDLQEGLREIAGILGENIDDAILDRIFSTFCIGK